MRVALFGSPAFAIPSLHALHQKHDLVLVVTQPDKPAHRGMKLTPPATAKEAKRLGLNLEQPQKLKHNLAFHEQLAKLKLDVAITAAYGKILPQSILDLPKEGFLNIHASLLPKYRGAAPIQWALINGEKETGISIMQTEAGLDTGAVRLAERLAIHPHDTSLSLAEKLSQIGSEVMLTALEQLAQGSLASYPQDDKLVSFAPLLSKADGRIRWQDHAQAILNRFRGVLAWPGSWTLYKENPLKIHQLSMGDLNAAEQTPQGRILAIEKKGITVASKDSAILLQTVQAAGKAKMHAFDWANGHRVTLGDSLG